MRVRVTGKRKGRREIRDIKRKRRIRRKGYPSGQRAVQKEISSSLELQMRSYPSGRAKLILIIISKYPGKLFSLLGDVKSIQERGKRKSN